MTTAPVVVNAGLTRCPACSCNVPSSHRPRSEACHDARLERLASIAD